MDIKVWMKNLCHAGTYINRIQYWTMATKDLIYKLDITQALAHGILRFFCATSD